MKAKHLVPAFLLLGSAIAATAIAGPRGGFGRIEGLNLSVDQQARLEALRQTHHEQIKALRTSDERPSRETMQALREQSRADFKAVLTPEQIATLEAHRAERKDGNATSTSSLQVAPSTAIEQKTWGEVKKDTQD